MKTVFIPWKTRVEDLKELHCNSGSSLDACETEWWLWLRGEYPEGTDFEVEPIPRKAYNRLVQFVEEEVEE